MRKSNGERVTRNEKRVTHYALLVIILALFTSASLAIVAPDPTQLSRGGRVLGLGRAYVGLADDVSSVYTNPAGLAQLETWQLSSFTGRLVEEFTYLSLTGAYTTNFGNFGLGFAGASIGGAPVTIVKPGTETDPIYEIDPNQTPVSYYNNVFALGYGFDNKSAPPFIKDMFKIAPPQIVPILDKMKFGASLKLFSSGLAGDGIVNGNASGMDMDAGILYKAAPWSQIGFTVKNFLPAALGGKLTYTNGHEESYPAVLELGTYTKILGKKETSLREFPQEVALLADVNVFPTQNTHPSTWHLGAEWTPYPILALRLGIDQDITGDGSGGLKMANNLTGGVGLTYSGFRFDYAFHQFDYDPGENNHFFSFSYGIPVEKKTIKYFTITSPVSETVTFESTAIVSGKIERFEVQTIKINNSKVKVSAQAFSATAPLSIGKNVVKVEAFDKDGKLLDKKLLKILKLPSYPDVPPSHWAREQIGYIAAMGVIKGYPDGGFKPEGNINRAEMAAILIRTNTSEEGLAAPKKQQFNDVNLNNWAAKLINEAVNRKIVKGYPGNIYKPSANISRAEGLAMVARFAGVSEEAYYNQFTDVNEKHWAAKTIAGAYKAGMLRFLEKQPFETERKLNRAESVEILFRSPYVQKMIKNNLLNWAGY